MAGENSIQILRGATTYDPSTSEEILLDGQPFYSKKDRTLYIGDGSTQLQHLIPVANDTNYAKLDSANTFNNKMDVCGNILNDYGITANKALAIAQDNGQGGRTYGFDAIKYSGLYPDERNAFCDATLKLPTPKEGTHVETFATQEWVNENVSIDDSNYAKLDSANTFSSEMDVCGNVLNDYGITTNGNFAVVQDNGQGGRSYTFDAITYSGFYPTTGNMANQTLKFPVPNGTTEETLATQEWVTANAGGGGSSTTSASYVGSNGYSVTIDPNATNPILIDAGLGTDNPNGLKVSSNMKYMDSVVYKSTGISATIANDYGNSTQTVTTLQFPRNEDSVSTITNTLNVPNSNGTIATEEWVTANINTAASELQTYTNKQIASAKNYIDNLTAYDTLLSGQYFKSKTGTSNIVANIGSDWTSKYDFLLVHTYLNNVRTTTIVEKSSNRASVLVQNPWTTSFSLFIASIIVNTNGDINFERCGTLSSSSYSEKVNATGYYISKIVGVKVK